MCTALEQTVKPQDGESKSEQQPQEPHEEAQQPPLVVVVQRMECGKSQDRQHYSSPTVV